MKGRYDLPPIDSDLSGSRGLLGEKRVHFSQQIIFLWFCINCCDDGGHGGGGGSRGGGGRESGGGRRGGRG